MEEERDGKHKSSLEVTLIKQVLAGQAELSGDIKSILTEIDNLKLRQENVELRQENQELKQERENTRIDGRLKCLEEWREGAERSAC